VDFLDATTPVYKAVKMSSSNPHSRYPVVRGSHDEVVGFVHVRDLFAPEVHGATVRVGEIAREVKMMPGTKRVLSAMSEMRREGHHLATGALAGGDEGVVVHQHAARRRPIQAVGPAQRSLGEIDIHHPAVDPHAIELPPRDHDREGHPAAGARQPSFGERGLGSAGDRERLLRDRAVIGARRVDRPQCHH
jgi:CBS domain-containing protein